MSTAKAVAGRRRPTLVVDNDPMVGGLTVNERRVRDAANYISRRITNLKAGEAWLDIGRELAELKTFLKKNSKHDKSRDGWLAAFKKNTRVFPFARTRAEQLILVHEKLSVTTVTPKELPASARTLIKLSKLPDSHREQAVKLCSPATTATDVTRIAKEIGVPTTKATTGKSQKAKGANTKREVARANLVACLATLKKETQIDELREIAAELGLVITIRNKKND